MRDVWLPNEQNMATVSGFPGVVGDGRNDDTAGLQAALDSGASIVFLPKPPGNYLISRTLTVHSAQTILVDRNAVIRLADHAHVHMLTNADHERGDHGITVAGGIWDGNNLHQTCEYHENDSNWRVPYDPERYLGVLMQFNRVKDLRIAHVTFKDPETFGFQGGNLERFTIEDVTFDYNLQRLNMDGVHIHGNCHQGRITNLKGTTNDDLVALNADDGDMFEMSRGPITDIQVDGIWSDNGYTAVRLLSAGSPVRRIKLSNIFGSYRYNVVSFTDHRVRPEEPRTFADISIEGVFCSKSTVGMDADPSGKPWSGLAPIWIDAPAIVSNLVIRDYHRTEAALPTDDIHIEPGATVENLVLSEVTLANRCGAPITLFHNRGRIGNLALQNVYAKAEGAGAGGQIVKNAGTILRLHQMNVVGDGFETGL
jgi:hypothetical protein